MRNKVKNGILLAVAGLMSGILSAQPAGQCRKLEDLRLWMKDSLELTETQEKKIGSWHDSACTAIQNIRNEAAGDREAIKTGTREVMRGLHEKYSSILSESQMQKLHDHRKAASGQRKRDSMSAEDMAAQMTARMKEVLSLSEAQEKQVHALNLELIQKRRELMGNATDADREEKKKELKRHIKSYNESVKAILDDTQEEQWEAWKAQFRKSHKNRGQQ